MRIQLKTWRSLRTLRLGEKKRRYCYAWHCKFETTKQGDKMKKIKILPALIAAIALLGFSMVSCNRAPQSSAGADNSSETAGSADIAVSGRAPEADVKAGLYAKAPPISGDDTPIAGVAANNLKAAFDYVNANPGSQVNPILYTLVIDQDVTSGPVFLGAPPAADEPVANITIIGLGGERTIQYNGPVNEVLFYIGDTIQGYRGRLTLGNNITLKGIQTSERPLVGVDFGSMVMEAGSKITGHKTSSISGAVSVYDTFVMNGGEISGNESTYMQSAGAVFVSFGATQGNFTMNGGTITRNTGGFGTGVFVDGDDFGHAVFTMNGGTITGNTNLGELPQPLDVWIWDNAIFNNNGGSIGVLENRNN